MQNGKLPNHNLVMLLMLGWAYSGAFGTAPGAALPKCPNGFGRNPFSFKFL
jgi:hypothetical protein